MRTSARVLLSIGLLNSTLLSMNLISGCASSTGPVGLPSRPDPRLTPGEAFADATVGTVCVPGYARRTRNVLAEQYVQVFTAYRVAFPQPTGAYELDHLIPLELGGDNDNRNLWPQPSEPLPGFNQKDELENLLHERVCSGAMSLLDAQRGIAVDWVAMYRRFVHS